MSGSKTSGSLITPRRRNSIHRDKREDGESDSKGKSEGVIKKCIKCNEEVQMKLPDENAKRSKANKNKSKLCPDAPEIEDLLCELCKRDTLFESAPFEEGYSAEGDSLPNEEAVSTKAVTQNKNIFFNLATVVGIIIAVLAIFIIAYFNYFKNGEVPFDVNVGELDDWELFLENRLYGLKNTYKNQEEKVWYSLSAAIKSVMNFKPTQPSVILFLYDNQSAGETAKCLAYEVSKIATIFLMHIERKPLIYTGTDFNKKRFLDDPGRLLVDLNDTIRAKGAMVVSELQDVPPKVATSLHFVCDSYSPLVEKAVLFFTLKVDEVPRKKLSKAAGDKLKSLWTDKMEDSLINPLITRITPNTIGITNDYIKC